MMTNREYLTFAQKHPQLFVNPPGVIFTILLDEDKIQQAEAEMTRRLAAHNLPAEWAKVGIVYQDQYLLLLRDAVRFPDGSLGTYIRFVNPDGAPGVIILPVCQGRVVLLRHFRHATRTWHLEIPRGFGEQGSASEANARRELAEEIGAAGAGVHLVFLGEVYSDTGMSAASNKLYYAEIETYGKVDINEAIAKVHAVPIAEFERLIRDNEITDGLTLSAYAYAKARGLL